MACTIEHIYKIYNDAVGSHIEVGPNADGLEGLWDIKYVEPNNKVLAQFTVSVEELSKLTEVFNIICLDSRNRG